MTDGFTENRAKLFGIAPISASFKTSHTVLAALGGHQTSTRVLCAILVVIMAATTFLTQRQMMARNGPMEGQAAQTQKILLYIFPLSFFFYGWVFPVGVLLYWLTTNSWTMGQQYLVIHRIEGAAAAAAPAVGSGPSGPRPGAKPQRGPQSAASPKPPAAPATPSGPAPGAKPGGRTPGRSTGNIVLPPGGAISGVTPGVSSPSPTNSPPTRPSANRSNKRKKRGRR